MLVAIASERGSGVRLLGYYRQLGAVESGGALRLIANESGAVELSTLYRFANTAEAEATRGRVGHRAYWIAAASLLALRGARWNGDPSWNRLAADRYQTLDEDEQNGIAAELADRLSQDWLGDVRVAAVDADQPVYHQQLAAILVEYGHLNVPEPGLSGGRAPRNPSARGRVKQRHGRSVEIGPQQTLRTPQTRLPNRQPDAQTRRPPQMPQVQPRTPRPGCRDGHGPESASFRQTPKTTCFQRSAVDPSCRRQAPKPATPVR